MQIFRKIAFLLVFTLMMVSQLFAFSADSRTFHDPGAEKMTDSVPASELQMPVSSYLFAIQQSNSAQIITEVHKLSALIIHPNQIVPFDFDFRSFASYPVPTIYNSPVPIFIRGHALLN